MNVKIQISSFRVKREDMPIENMKGLTLSIWVPNAHTNTNYLPNYKSKI